jgi:hypothetical protein
MAKKDTDRYKREMNIFYKEELALMCSGHASSSPDEDDKKPSSDEQQQVAAATLSTAPSLENLLGASGQATSFASMSSEQIAQVFNMLRQQGFENINKEEIITMANAERATIKKRRLAILLESEALQKKDRLLEHLVNSVVLSEPRAFAHAAFPGVNVGIPAYGNLGTLSNEAMLNQLVASQQLQQQLGGGLSAAAAVSRTTQVANQSQVPAQSPTATNQTQPSMMNNNTSLSGHLAAPFSNSFGLAGLASLGQPYLHDALLLNQYLAMQQQQQRQGSAPAPPDYSNLKNEDSTE